MILSKTWFAGAGLAVALASFPALAEEAKPQAAPAVPATTASPAPQQTPVPQQGVKAFSPAVPADDYHDCGFTEDKLS